MTFSYSASDFNRSNLSLADSTPSDFDTRLESAFDKALENGVLRYEQPRDFNQRKTLSTAAGLAMVAEFNPNRGFNKRQRQTQGSEI